MAGLGEFLRSRRESAGLTLEEISASTCISTPQLLALEEERLEELPGGVFNVSFVRQFAREVKADEDEAVAKLKALTTVTPGFSFAAETDSKRDAYLRPGPVGRIAEEAGRFFREQGGTLSTLAIGLLLLIGGAYSYDAWEQDRAQVASQAIAQAEAEAEDEAVSRRGALEGAARHAVVRAEAIVPKAPIELELEIVETVWIRAFADGERVLEGTFRQGARKPILAREQVTLKVGNAGGVRLALNGEAMPSIGPRGHVRSVRVTVDGVEVIGGTPSPSLTVPAQTPPTTSASVRDPQLAWTR